jgi:hypothetical protein
MKTPTIKDLQGMMPEARAEADAGVMPRSNSEPYAVASIARDTLGMLVPLLMQSVVDWPNVRRVALRAMYLCALIAWEAGRRMAPSTYDRVRIDGKEYPPSGADSPQGKSDVEALRPFDDGDIRRLLWDADQWDKAKPAPRLLRDLAAVLRAEREKAEDAEASAKRGWEARDAMAIQHGRAQATRLTVTAHLRAVLDFMWPVGGWMTSPAVVQRARAFLAGEEQAPGDDEQHYRDRAWRAEQDLRATGDLARAHEQTIEALRKELADKGAALERMVERHELACAARDELKGRLAADEVAHATTRTRLAEVEWERDALQGSAIAGAKLAATLALYGLPNEAKALAGALNRRNGDMAAALAAQNRAESEAAGLRAQLADLETAIGALVVRVEKGRA